MARRRYVRSGPCWFIVSVRDSVQIFVGRRKKGEKGPILGGFTFFRLWIKWGFCPLLDSVNLIYVQLSDNHSEIMWEPGKSVWFVGCQEWLFHDWSGVINGCSYPNISCGEWLSCKCMRLWPSHGQENVEWNGWEGGVKSHQADKIW